MPYRGCQPRCVGRYSVHGRGIRKWPRTYILRRLEGRPQGSQAMTGPARRILFVDDDPPLLSGLSKALRKYRDRWAMVFAGSGEAALAEVRTAGFDVVVSDMRMPV